MKHYLLAGLLAAGLTGAEANPTKNKLGATVFDSAQFMVYKGEKVERLQLGLLLTHCVKAARSLAL